jgi:hypothetical protein
MDILPCWYENLLNIYSRTLTISMLQTKCVVLEALTFLVGIMLRSIEHIGQ